MGRPHNTTPSAMLNLRVDKDFKTRLTAAAYHDMVRTAGITNPDQVNLSEWLRTEVLEPWLKNFERRRGGREALASEYGHAQAESLRALLNSVELSLLETDSDSSKSTTIP